MRKLWISFASVLVMVFFLGTVAQAANVTNVNWVTRNDAPIPFVRIVLSLTSPVEASAAIDEVGTHTTVTLKNTKIVGAPTSLTMDSSIASHANLVASGNNTNINITTPKAIDVGDIKVFTLKKDTVNNKPYRMVIDIQKKGVAPREYYYGKKPVDKKGSVESKIANKKETMSKAEPKKEDPKKNQESTPNKNSGNKAKPTTSISYDYRTTGGLAGKIIALDAGHGGSDPGAIGPTGLQEKQVTLPIAKHLKSMLEAKGAKVIMTRTTDVDVFGPHASGPDELQARVDVANYGHADAFISIHINSFSNPSVGGIATYYFDGSEYSRKLAKNVQDEIAEQSGFIADRGIQPSNLYVLRHSTMPSILVELGFISNPKEEGLLKTDATQQGFAKEMVEGLENYFGG